jgi:hypothetical protein
MASRLGRIPSTWWAKSAAAGLVGGLVMALSWSIGSALMGHGFWMPLTAVGTTMPNQPLAPGASGFTMLGAFLHLLTAFCWGVIYGVLAGVVAPRYATTPGRAALMGLGFGLFSYVLMGLIVGPLVDPRITAVHPVNYFVGHVVFGVVTALSLYAMTRRRELSVSFAPGVTARDRARSIR